MALRFKVVPHVALSFTKKERELVKIHFFDFGTHFRLHSHFLSSSLTFLFLFASLVLIYK
jgi:hypothetical protein